MVAAFHSCDHNRRQHSHSTLACLSGQPGGLAGNRTKPCVIPSQFARPAERSCRPAYPVGVGRAVPGADPQARRASSAPGWWSMRKGPQRRRPPGRRRAGRWPRPGAASRHSDGHQGHHRRRGIAHQGRVAAARGSRCPDRRPAGGRPAAGGGDRSGKDGHRRVRLLRPLAQPKPLGPRAWATRRAGPAAGRPWPWRPACVSAPWARRPAARWSARPPTAASPPASRPSAASVAEGIVPVSYHLDHPGPMARSVADLANPAATPAAR